MLGQVFSAAAVCTFFPYASPRECPFSQFSANGKRDGSARYLWGKRPEIARGNVYGVPHRPAASQLVSPARALARCSGPALVTCPATRKALSLTRKGLHLRKTSSGGGI